MQKYGFVYIWFDRKRKMYYIGSHWGNENDGYICSSKWMRDAYRYRKNDFKRRVIKKVYSNRKDLLEEEYKFLSLIVENELGKKYYNLSKHLNGHWTASSDEYKKLSIKEKISIKTKEAMNRPDVRENFLESRKHLPPRSKEAIEKTAKANTGQKRTEETKRKIREALTGEKNPFYGIPLSEEHKRNISESLKGEKNHFYGKTHSDETKTLIAKKVSEKLKGKKPKNLDWLNSALWWNNGSINKRSPDCPGEGWVRGRIKKVKP
jgi:hypothetical protein